MYAGSSQKKNIQLAFGEGSHHKGIIADTFISPQLNFFSVHSLLDIINNQTHIKSFSPAHQGQTRE
jgi:hypothetical protein